MKNVGVTRPVQMNTCVWNFAMHISFWVEAVTGLMINTHIFRNLVLQNSYWHIYEGCFVEVISWFRSNVYSNILLYMILTCLFSIAQYVVFFANVWVYISFCEFYEQVLLGSTAALSLMTIVSVIIGRVFQSVPTQFQTS